MSKLTFLIYIGLGLYVLVITWRYVSYIFKHKHFRGMEKAVDISKYTLPILLFAVFFFPLQFYYSIAATIPEQKYWVNAVLEIDGFPNTYAVAVTLSKDIDRVYYEDELFDGRSSVKSEVYEYFMLQNVDIPMLENEGYYIDEICCLPDSVESNKSYSIELRGEYYPEGYRSGDEYMYHEEFKYFEPELTKLNATLSIPPLTKEVLGITFEEQLKSVSVVGYIEHIGFTVCALFSSICTYKILKCKEK